MKLIGREGGVIFRGIVKNNRGGGGNNSTANWGSLYNFSRKESYGFNAKESRAKHSGGVWDIATNSRWDKTSG